MSEILKEQQNNQTLGYVFISRSLLECLLDNTIECYNEWAANAPHNSKLMARYQDEIGQTKELLSKST